MTSQTSSEPQERPDSELLFEQYLLAHGLNQWDYETEIEGKKKRPDYRLEFQGDLLFFDVKEFHRKSNESPRGPIAYDPYPPVREKINAAREKFKEYKELFLFPCVTKYQRLAGTS